MEDTKYKRKNEEEQALMASILQDNQAIEDIMEGRIAEIDAENRQVKTQLLRKIADDTEQLKSIAKGTIKNESEAKESITSVISSIDALAKDLTDARAQGVTISNAKERIQQTVQYIDNLAISVPSMDPQAKMTTRNSTMDLAKAAQALLFAAGDEYESIAMNIPEALMALERNLKDSAQVLKPANIEMQLKRVQDAIALVQQFSKAEGANDLFNNLKMIEADLLNGNKLSQQEYTQVIRQIDTVKENIRRFQNEKKKGQSSSSKSRSKSTPPRNSRTKKAGDELKKLFSQKKPKQDDNDDDDEDKRPPRDAKKKAKQKFDFGESNQSDDDNFIPPPPRQGRRRNRSGKGIAMAGNTAATLRRIVKAYNKINDDFEALQSLNKKAYNQILKSIECLDRKYDAVFNAKTKQHGVKAREAFDKQANMLRTKIRTAKKEGKGIKSNSYNMDQFLKMNSPKNREAVLKGSIMSGNNSPAIRQELKSLK